MASIKRLKVYAEIEAGKRMVSISCADLPALRMWLWRNGYSFKTNVNGRVCNVLIEKKP